MAILTLDKCIKGTRVKVVHPGIPTHNGKTGTINNYDRVGGSIYVDMDDKSLGQTKWSLFSSLEIIEENQPKYLTKDNAKIGMQVKYIFETNQEFFGKIGRIKSFTEHDVVVEGVGILCKFNAFAFVVAGKPVWEIVDDIEPQKEQMNHWPHKCPCGSPAYMSLIHFECSNERCPFKV